MGKVRGRSGEGLSGLIGNVVFFSYNGETYFRSAPGCISFSHKLNQPSFTGF
jgi:hypothetical protein